MMKRVLAIVWLLGSAVLFSGQALAAADWGPCTPTGGTHSFSAVLNKEVTDTSKNTRGAVFDDFFVWDLGGSYAGSCECPDGSDIGSTVYSTVTSLPFGHTDGDNRYYVVDEHIQIATSIFIGGDRQDYVKAPFSDVSNLLPPGRGNCDVNPQSVTGFSTGSKGKLSLYIAHPFVGELIIPQTKIMDVYGTYKAGVYSATPLASVNISGTITVPQGCELSSGSTLEIPFGEFKASDFKGRQGQIANNATKYVKQIQFKCTNIADGVKIFLHIEGTPNKAYDNAIDMGNPDIGALIEDAHGNVLKPNDMSSNQEMVVSGLVDETHRTATTTISAYPVSTTGNLPAAGEFEGIATMRVDVE
jgi:P pilus assembly protein, pilin FimA